MHQMMVGLCLHVPSLSDSCSEALTASLHIATVILEKPDIRSPSFTASSTSMSGGNTLLTNPNERASSADILSPICLGRPE